MFLYIYTLLTDQGIYSALMLLILGWLFYYLFKSSQKKWLKYIGCFLGSIIWVPAIIQLVIPILFPGEDTECNGLLCGIGAAFVYLVFGIIIFFCSFYIFYSSAFPRIGAPRALWRIIITVAIMIALFIGTVFLIQS